MLKFQLIGITEFFMGQILLVALITGRRVYSEETFAVRDTA